MKKYKDYLFNFVRIYVLEGSKGLIYGELNGSPIGPPKANLTRKGVDYVIRGPGAGLWNNRTCDDECPVRPNVMTTTSLALTNEKIILTAVKQRVETVPKPFSLIPGPRGLPLIGTLWDYIKKNGYGFDKMFIAQQERSRLYGTIYKEKIGPELMVVITDPKEYSKVVRTDAKYPRRMGLEPMIHYRKIKDLPIGLFNAVGEEWYKYRKVLNHKMLDASEANNYLPKLNEVAEDFVQRLVSITRIGENVCMESELFKWAMESLIQIVRSKALETNDIS